MYICVSIFNSYQADHAINLLIIFMGWSARTPYWSNLILKPTTLCVSYAPPVQSVQTLLAISYPIRSTNLLFSSILSQPGLSSASKESWVRKIQYRLVTNCKYPPDQLSDQPSWLIFLLAELFLPGIFLPDIFLPDIFLPLYLLTRQLPARLLLLGLSIYCSPTRQHE